MGVISIHGAKMMMFLLLLSACDSVGDELDLEHPDEKLVAGKLLIWWDEGYGPPYQSLAGDSLKAQFDMKLHDERELILEEIQSIFEVLVLTNISYIRRGIIVIRIICR